MIELYRFVPKVANPIVIDLNVIDKNGTNNIKFLHSKVPLSNYSLYGTTCTKSGKKLVNAQLLVGKQLTTIAYSLQVQPLYIARIFSIWMYSYLKIQHKFKVQHQFYQFTQRPRCERRWSFWWCLCSMVLGSVSPPSSTSNFINERLSAPRKGKKPRTVVS